MRYSVVSKGLTILQLQVEVVKYGGRNLKVATASKQVFADLDVVGITKLQALGCSVNKIGGVRAVVLPPVVAPPAPIAGIPIYRPEDLILTIGLEELRSATDPPLYGEGMNLAIIGTGIRETHKKINGRVIYRKNYTTSPMSDGFDHDTGVCDIVLTVAPLCNILNLKVLDDDGQGSEEDVAIAIDDCILLWDTNPTIAPTVINLSLGGPDEGNPNNPLRVACRAAIDKGIWVLASAGNGGPIPYSVTCPACEQYVFAVGSTRYEPFIVSDFSSRGPTMEGLIKPEAVMFGENISMASSTSDIVTVAKSGTSFAVPFCSGMALLYQEGVRRQALTTIQLVELPPTEIYYVSSEEIIDTYLRRLCIKPQGISAGKDYDYGYGLPYGPLMRQAILAAPLLDISTILQSVMPIIGLAMLGMIIVPMMKGIK